MPRGGYRSGLRALVENGGGFGLERFDVHVHGVRRASTSPRFRAVGMFRGVASLPFGASEVTPDFVGLTDVAELVGVTRQNMRKLMLSHPTTFPAPIHEGSASVWHLAHVLRWLAERGDYEIERPLIDIASMAMQVNLANEALGLDAPVHKEVRALVA
jgi:predicted DNA-binding transcriptional regulator AlpA